jgi:hypothetical protein
MVYKLAVMVTLRVACLCAAAMTDDHPTSDDGDGHQCPGPWCTQERAGMDGNEEGVDGGDL